MINKISDDIVAALKNKDKTRLAVLRMLKSTLKYHEIEIKRKLSEEESLKILKSQVKSREQAIELYQKGNRYDLSEIEQNEIKIIREYLPKPISTDELIREVSLVIKESDANSMKDMGKVMKLLSQKLGSRADGKLLSKIVKEKLSN